MNERQNKVVVPSLPPRLPQNEQELNRAILLLGCRKQVELSAPTRMELARLIGVYPTVAEAMLWKRVLRRACQEAK
jgi:hypothetical protein